VLLTVLVTRPTTGPRSQTPPSAARYRTASLSAIIVRKSYPVLRSLLRPTQARNSRRDSKRPSASSHLNHSRATIFSLRSSTPRPIRFLQKAVSRPIQQTCIPTQVAGHKTAASRRRSSSSSSAEEGLQTLCCQRHTRCFRHLVGSQQAQRRTPILLCHSSIRRQPLQSAWPHRSPSTTFPQTYATSTMAAVRLTKATWP
jgi:hypothetical protein